MEFIIQDQVVELPINIIASNPWNPHVSSSDELRLISDSIRELGQLVPILVVNWDAPVKWEDVEYFEKDKYLVVDGEQRLKAMTHLFKEGNNDALMIRAIVIGNASDYEPWELAEFGQAANHARAKTEDDLKTGKVMTEILKYRNISDYSKIVGQRVDYLSRTLELVKNREAKMLARTASTKAAGIPVQTVARGYYTVSLPFETSDEVEEFENLLNQLPSAGKSYRGLERSYRLLNTLREVTSSMVE